MCRTYTTEFLGILFISLFFAACDSDKFLNYNYDAERVLEVAAVTGQVTNLFTGVPVMEAQIQIGAQTTTSDDSGFYRLDYELSADDQLGSDVDIVVTADDYHALTTSRQFFPTPTTVDFRLEFGAPILQTISFPELSFVQIRLFDYQGVDNIDSVYAKVSYIDPATNSVSGVLTLGLDHVEDLDSRTAHYQTVVLALHPDLGSASPSILVGVIDKDGFSLEREHTNNILFQPDVFLFDPGI